MRKRVVALAAVGLAALGSAPFLLGPGRIQANEEWRAWGYASGFTARWVGVEEATESDHVALDQAVLREEPIPPGWEVIEHHSGLDSVLTGPWRWPFRRRAVLTLVDDERDLSEARLLVDGDIVATASLESGGIERRGAFVQARLEADVPLWPWTHFRLEWSGAAGEPHWTSTYAGQRWYRAAVEQVTGRTRITPY